MNLENGNRNYSESGYSKSWEDFTLLVARDHNNSSAEDHIQFNWINTKLIPKTKILLVSMKKNLLRWLKDKKTIWGSQA